MERWKGWRIVERIDKRWPIDRQNCEYFPFCHLQKKYPYHQKEKLLAARELPTFQRGWSVEIQDHCYLHRQRGSWNIVVEGQVQCLWHRRRDGWFCKREMTRCWVFGLAGGVVSRWVCIVPFRRHLYDDDIHGTIAAPSSTNWLHGSSLLTWCPRSVLSNCQHCFETMSSRHGSRRILGHFCHFEK